MTGQHSSTPTIATESSPHIPIMVPEIVSFLDIQPSDTVLDGTVGFGGHASALLPSLSYEKGGRYLGFDQDKAAIAYCTNTFKDTPTFQPVHSNFSAVSSAFLKPLLPDTSSSKYVDKVLLDLGMSSFHIDGSGRGFSFLKNEPLDLRMDQTKRVTAKHILATYSLQQLSDIFFNYGELFQNKRLCETIIQARGTSTSSSKKGHKQAKSKHSGLHTTDDLMEAIKTSYSLHSRNHLLKTAAKVFQALRIEVNNELGVLDSFLDQCLDWIRPGGIVAILSFHSLEDRRVKQFVKAHKDQVLPLTKKVVMASQEEIKANSRSKSAKLRVFQVIA